MNLGDMTPIWIRTQLDPNGKYLVIEVVSTEKSLHVSQYIDVIEGWVSAAKKQFEKEIKEFQDLQKSGKLVSMSEWKKKDGAY